MIPRLLTPPAPATTHAMSNDLVVVILAQLCTRRGLRHMASSVALITIKMPGAPVRDNIR